MSFFKGHRSVPKFKINIGAVLHIPPVLAAHLKQSLCDLPQGAIFHRLHKGFKYILVVYRLLLQFAQYGGAFFFIAHP